MGKWTNQGFVVNSLDYYKTELNKLFKNAFGEDFLIDDTLPQGIFIQRLAELLFNTDMDGVEGFSRLNPNSATGVYLDLIGVLRSVPRKIGSPQTATVKITCSANNFIPFTIPKGTQFLDLGTAETFVSPTSITVDIPDGLLVVLEYSENGNSTSLVGGKMSVNGFGQITDIEITALVEGQGNESDLDYRFRLLNEFPVATNTIDFVQNKLLEIQEVKTVGHNYNDTAETVDTLGPYTTEWMVVPKATVNESAMQAEGGFLDKVAETILNNKVPGAPTAGNTSRTVTDVFGTEKEVHFTLATKIELEIEVRVTTPETTGILDLSRLNEHIQTIEKYINGLNIGKEVSYSRCIAPLAADIGFDIQWFRIRKKGDEQWQENTNYGIGIREYASISTSDIKIGV